jgi:hypothetical protein
MKQLIFCLSLVLFFGCKETPKKTVDNKDKTNSPDKTIQKEKHGIGYQKQIVPGKRLGSIILNQDATAIMDSLGKPDSGDAAMGKALSTWGKNPNHILTLYTSRQMGVEDFSRVKVIRTLSPDYRTEDNLGVNTPLAELKRYYRLEYAGKFAYNGKHYLLYTTNKGIAFEVGMNQKCHGVLLYDRNENVTATYLPIYADFDFKEP